MDDGRSRTGRNSATRRALLQRLAAMCGAGAAATVAMSDAAHAATALPPLTKAAVGYRDLPDYGEACGECVYYIQPTGAKAYGRCKMVAGQISGAGWCQIWAPKSKNA